VLMSFPHLIVGGYVAVLVLLMLYAAHRYCILFLYFKHKGNSNAVPALPEKLPRVTIQLPLYNEVYVVERLITAAAKIAYPPELLQVQVLDDSTDETSARARTLVCKLREAGHAIEYLHRTNRDGYKAGALQAGLTQASGELIAIFDADFVPPEDFLLQTVPHLADPRVGMVQTLWGHLNRDYSALTEVQAISLDAHFILEHTARSSSGRFFNFNGTAGIWRKDCIVSAGGWQHDTLTEDLDLSYRAQLAGWKFIFLPQVVTPAEIPVDMDSFKSQQHRWAKGGIETAKKLLPRILRSSQPWQVKLEALLHLSCNLNYLLVLLLAMLAYPALIVRIQMGWKHLVILDTLMFWGATLPIGLYYLISQREVRQPWGRKILYLPLLMAMWIGLCINNGKAALEALLGYKSVFVRTPKFRIENKADTWKGKKYQSFSRTMVTVFELGFGVYFISAIIFAARCEVYTAIPFLALFCCGFFYSSGVSLLQRCRGKRQSAAVAVHTCRTVS
jgi:cellulose synthase/poly-beta-1,6-N-acetylglucosamine synthase-like glycosyltransferase